MSLLFETIRLQDGVLQNLEYHNLRLNQSRRAFYNSKDTIDLTKLISVPDVFRKGIVKCKVSYSADVEKITFEAYTPRTISSLKLVEDNNIEYGFKYSDRDKINNLLAGKDDFDDILIIKNGFITDTSFSNIILYDGLQWITPAVPLLYGTMRSNLVRNKIITEEDIKISDLQLFQKIRLINAMIPFETGIDIPTGNIGF